jgi:predicted DNA-binding protein
MNGAKQTHQTTLRFSEELWRRLERAAEELDISVAQYVRDAARARLAQDGRARSELGEELRVEAENARQHALGEAESSAALWEQGRLARERARVLRDEARSRRTVGPR